MGHQRARASRHRAPQREGVRPLRARPWGGSSQTCTSGRCGTSRTSTRGSARSASNGVPQSPSIYRKLYLAGHAGLSATGHGGDRILLGELMPRGGTSPKKIRPLVFLRELVCLDSNYRQYRGRAARARGCGKVGRIPTSGLAYHPYTLRGGPADPRRPRRRRDRRAEPRDEGPRRARAARQAPAQAAALDHRVRLPDEPARSLLRRAAEARRRVHGHQRVHRFPRPAHRELLPVHAPGRAAPQ